MNDAPASSLERVRAAARDLGLDIAVRTMDQSTRTAAEAAAACGCAIGQIVKSLVFEDAASGALVLLLVSGDHTIDLDFVAGTYGLSLKRTEPRKVRDVTGFAIGGVAPIGHLNAPSVYLDESLLAHPMVWCAAGRPDSVFSVDPARLCEAAKAERIKVRA